jgi:hypothetical protein
MGRKKHKSEAKMSEENHVETIESKEVAVAPECDTSAPISELEAIRAEIELEKAKLELQQLRDKSKIVPNRIIDEEEQKIVDRQIARINEDKTIKEKIRAQKDYDNQMVTGKFMNRRAPGQMAKLTYIKYEDDPIKWYEFYDGKVYTIPRGFADQINEHYHTPVFIQKDGPIEDNDNPGSQIAEVDTSNKKYAFMGVNY